MTQFPDPYLKGASEPDWMKRRVPDVDKQDATRALDKSVGGGLKLE